jgi:fluoroquinolone transport system permease protein
MKRLTSTIRWDIQLQMRNGFYYASAFVAAALVIVLKQVGASSLAILLPAFLLENMLINTFYFISALVLLEKREGTMEAQIVTPLRAWEYLASKVITLTALSILESLAIVLFTYGFRFDWLSLLAGIMLLGGFYAYAGFTLVARYDSINEFLLPSIAFTTLFSLPLLPYFGIVEHWLFYLHPLQGAMLLLGAGFQPIPFWQAAYAVLYGGAWIGLLAVLGRRAFRRFVIEKEGVQSR